MPFPLAASRIEAAEAELGRMLPAAYRASMQRANGGCVAAQNEVWWLYPIFDDSDLKRLKRTCNDILRETRSAREWPEFPPDALATAHNGAGDYLILLPADQPGHYADSVFVWRHDVAECEAIARSFDSLPWNNG